MINQNHIRMTHSNFSHTAEIVKTKKKKKGYRRWKWKELPDWPAQQAAPPKHNPVGTLPFKSKRVF